MSFEEKIKQQILHHGPMDMAVFTGLANNHYYNNRDPLGVKGDFTTAPEISQMFGEMLGVWAANCWVQLGQPKSFILAECGPGRGTLMADALRATKAVAGFQDAAQIHLVETSETLRGLQKKALEGFDPQWHSNLSSLPNDLPIVLLANEFLDALPVHQYVFKGGKWQEKVVGVGDDGKLRFGLKGGHLDNLALPEAEEGDVFEMSVAQSNVIREISDRINGQGGAALFVDYGYLEGFGDTLQALKNHISVRVLDFVGDADLTSHVNFGAMKAAAKCPVFGPVDQGDFLLSLGLSLRAQALKKKGDQRQQQDIDQAFMRLSGKRDGEMGALFKAMALASEPLKPVGFNVS